MFTADTLVLTNARAEAVAIVDATGTQISTFGTPIPPANATLTQVAQNVASVSLLAANLNRRQILITNTGTKTLFVAFAASATVTAFSVLIPSQGQFAGALAGYTGVVSGIWAGAGSGFAVITEVTQ